jgi:hypothetical protein
VVFATPAPNPKTSTYKDALTTTVFAAEATPEQKNVPAHFSAIQWVMKDATLLPERARRIGGKVAIETHPGGGTRVIVSVPVGPDDAVPGPRPLRGRSASVPRQGVSS